MYTVMESFFTKFFLGTSPISKWNQKVHSIGKEYFSKWNEKNNFLVITSISKFVHQ